MNKTAINIILVLVVLTLLSVMAIFVRIGATATRVVVLKTSGMTCGGCAGRVAELLQTEQGVAATEVELAKGRTVVGYDARLVTPQRLAGKLSQAGYGSTVQEVLTPAEYQKLTGHSICRTGSRPGCEENGAAEGGGCGCRTQSPPASP